MSPFQPATVTRESRDSTRRGLLKRFNREPLWAASFFDGRVPTLAQFLARVEEIIAGNGEVFLNDKYQVHRRELGDDQVHLSIRRLDRGHCHDWREFQQIKNELVGPECEGIELYPAESRLCDTANQWHLWCFKDATFRFPLGWQCARHVDDTPLAAAVNRPFESTE